MNESLAKMAKGATIAFVGMLIFVFFEFITRIIIARFTTQSEYGAFSIGLVLLNVFSILSCLGLQIGVSRCIAYYREQGDSRKVEKIVYSALQLSLAASIFFFLFVFFSSTILSEIFHLEQSIILMLFAVAIPFLTTIEILSYIFTGFDRVQEKVFFRDILLSLSRVTGVILAVIFGAGFLGIIYTYLLSIIIIAILFTFYAVKKLSIRKIEDNKIFRKKLFLFSFPLLITITFTTLNTRMDTIMLGYFKTSDIVGLYNAATPVAQLMQIFLSAMLLIYFPISSKLFSKNLMEELKRNHLILTKWVVAVTLPFFFIFFVFPETVLNIIFGPTYIQASRALQILSLGVFFQILLGPNNATLIVIGKTKLNMIDDIIGIIVNISLNLMLIPALGIIGAALATTVSLSTLAILKSFQVFHINRLHPLEKNCLKPVILSTILISIIYILINPEHVLSTLIIFFFLFLILYVFSLIITRSLDEEDFMMLLEIEKIMGKDFSGLKKTLKRFL